MGQQQGVEPLTMQSYQVAIRPHTDIRNPLPAFIAALAEHFEFATYLADGRMCVTAPHARPGDDTRDAVETVLHAAAAHREAVTKAPVRVQVTDARYTDDGYCHVLARCETAPAALTPERRTDAVREAV
jgi:hypothetical protein